MSLFSTPTGSDSPPAPRDSATVLLVRDGSGDEPEIFLVRRHQKSGFMAGAYVFPGGTLEEEDSDLAWLELLDPAQTAKALSMNLGEDSTVTPGLALHVCAIRETFEEAGVFLGTVPEGLSLSDARDAILAGQSFLGWAQEVGATLRADTLIPASRWVTPLHESRRYDARFFLAEAPGGQEAAPDQKETTAGSWWTPAQAVRQALAGEIFLPPPTLHTLHHLKNFASAARIFEDAKGRRPPRIQPEPSFEGDKVILSLPGDPLHSQRTPAFPGPTRVVLNEGRWSLEGGLGTADER